MAFPDTSSKGDLKSLKRAYKDKFGKMEEPQAPSNGHLEELLGHDKEEELEAESLKEVSTRCNETDEAFIPKFGADGYKEDGQATDWNRRVQVLSDSVGYAWGCVSLRHTHRPWLATLAPSVVL